MNADEFVEKIKSDMPTREYYYKEGLDMEFISRDEKRFLFQERAEPIKLDTNNDPILSLIKKYDTSTVEIGMITFFNDGIRILNDHICFGEFEVDYLGINEITKEIEVLEYSNGNVMCSCAQNSSLFLDAIRIISSFLCKRSMDDRLYNDTQANLTVAEICSNTAGGAKYHNFYRMLVGV